MHGSTLLNRQGTSLLAACLLAATAVACGKSSTTDDKTGATETCVTPDAAPAAGTPPECQHTMFAKYKLAGFGAVNKSIIDIALNANKTTDIGTSFQDKLANAGTARQTEFTNNLAAFLINAYGNSTDPDYVAYTGPSITSAHAGLKITTAQYNKFVSEVVVPALKVNGVPDADINNCFAPQVTDANFVATIVTCK